MRSTPEHGKQTEINNLKQRIRGIGERINSPTDPGYMGSGANWQEYAQVGEKIVALIRSLPLEIGSHKAAIELLQAINDCGGKLAGKGTEIFSGSFGIYAYFLRAIRKAKGLQDAAQLKAVEDIYQLYLKELGLEGDRLESLPRQESGIPSTEIAELICGDEFGDLKEMVVKLLISEEPVSRIEYSESGLRSQIQKDLYVILFSAITNNIHYLRQSFKERIQELKTTEEGGFYITQYHFHDIFRALFSPPHVSKALWQILIRLETPLR